MSLHGKTALLTGASSGIGKALAEKLSQEGVRLLLVARSQAKLQDLADSLPGESHIQVTDLRQPASLTALLETVKRHPPLDLLLNVAGVAALSPISTGNPEDWREMWEVNVQALAWLCQQCLPLFPETGGHILNLSSLSGHRVPPTGGFYAPTKFAVRGLTEALRLELRAAGNPTRVSAISPGFVDTPLLERYFEGRATSFQALKESGMLQAEDVAEAAFYLLNAPPTVEINDVPMRSISQQV
ncbi:MAG: SDR family oxidoreductase [Verrucomicrobiota bacterium]